MKSHMILENKWTCSPNLSLEANGFWSNLILLFLLHFMCMALPMHARMQKAMEHRGLWSWKAAYAPCTAVKEKHSKQDKVNRQRNKQLISLGSRITIAPMWMSNEHQHCLLPQKHFFEWDISYGSTRGTHQLDRMSFKAKKRLRNKS